MDMNASHLNITFSTFNPIPKEAKIVLTDDIDGGFRIKSIREECVLYTQQEAQCKLEYDPEANKQLIMVYIEAENEIPAGRHILEFRSINTEENITVDS